jgi:cytochrome c biogenesis protein CcdA
MISTKEVNAIQQRIQQQLGIMVDIFIAFLSGFAALLTPCVFL